MAAEMEQSQMNENRLKSRARTRQDAVSSSALTLMVPDDRCKMAPCSGIYSLLPLASCDIFIKMG